jgi:hypothetical protein
MITLTREEAQNVLNLLILWLDEQEEPDTETAVELLRAKLSEPEPKPVAYLVYDRGASSQHLAFDDELGDMDGCDIEPLYTAPPQREWQGLTVDEFYDLDDVGRKMILEYGRLVEAKIKGKNYDKR